MRASDLIWIFLLALFLLAAFLMGTAKGQEPVRTRVGVIGDSQAFLLMQPDALPAQAAQTNVRLLGRPAPGSSVISWARTDHDALLVEVLQFRPDVLVLVLGSNDAYMGPRIIANEPPFLRRLVRKLSRVVGRVVWLGPPDLVLARPGVAAFYAMLRSAELDVLDSRNVRLTYWDDKLHPDEPGRRAWAAWAWQRIVPSGN